MGGAFCVFGADYPAPMRLTPGGGQGPSEEDIDRGIAAHVHHLERKGRSREEAINHVAGNVAAYSIRNGLSPSLVMPRAISRVLLALDLVEGDGPADPGRC
jgi:hypothetical protein